MGKSRTFKPCPNTHPELLIIDDPGLCREFRVENWYLSRDGSGNIKHGVHTLTWMDALLVLLGAVLWPLFEPGVYLWLGATAVAVLCVYLKSSQVLWESILVIPPHGIQFETHRGFPGYPLSATRTFIPMTVLHNFIINEALYGWNVRFYLAALLQLSDGSSRMEVAYENIKPYFPVLIEVYQRVHEYLKSSTNKSFDPQGHPM